MNDTSTKAAASAAGLPLPGATQWLELLARDEPNNPLADGPTLAGLMDEQLAPGLREWTGALEVAAEKLIRHDATSSDVLPNRLNHIAALLARAGDQAEYAASEIRGQMRPFPWRPPGAPLPKPKRPRVARRRSGREGRGRRRRAGREHGRPGHGRRADGRRGRRCDPGRAGREVGRGGRGRAPRHAGRRAQAAGRRAGRGTRRARGAGVISTVPDPEDVRQGELLRDRLASTGSLGGSLKIDVSDVALETAYILARVRNDPVGLWVIVVLLDDAKNFGSPATP